MVKNKTFLERNPAAILPQTLDFQPLITEIEKYRAGDGSLFGFGLFQKNPAGDDLRIGGRILIEWAVMPSGVEDYLFLDCTQQVSHRFYVVDVGESPVKKARTAKDFPEDRQPQAMDNEAPNDDLPSNTSDNTPSSGLFYHYDAPGQRAANIENSAFGISRSSFRSWVRVKVNTSRVAFVNKDDLVEGTRASAVFEWHMAYYLKSTAKNTWWQLDTTPVTVSRVDESRPTDGTAVVTLLDKAISEGFVASYDATLHKWTLTGTSGNTATAQIDKGDDKAGATWPLEIANKVRVVITRGQIVAFPNNSEYKFSVFNSSLKVNELGEGTMDARAGP